MEDNRLELLNQYTRRNHTKDEVYLFDAVLCDNEIDRDGEQFSVKALEEIAEQFLGKTGIFDHRMESSGQTARIYGTSVEKIPGRKNSLGEDYVCVKAQAYMVRTDSNKDLIREIDAGIKKEVSISCCAKSRKCSVCHQEISGRACRHEKGKIYGGKKCFHILEDVKDAYEWSFVAVPAQVKAGIVKSCALGEAEEAEEVVFKRENSTEKSMLYPQKEETNECFQMRERL